MKASAGCMSIEDLRDFTRGTMPADRIDVVEEHLAICDFCLHAVECSSSQDPWLSEMESALRDAPTVGGSGDPFEFQLESALLALLGPTDNPDMIGRIGIYEIVGILGRGGMGVVFKAFDSGLNRFVAIKMLLPQMAASPAARARFRREGQAAAAVVDEHVLPIYAVDEWRGVPYLVTRYVRGTTLQRRLDEHGPLRLQEILRIALQAAHGLAAAHAQGLVHRDIKPSNILLEGTVDRAILADFGLARAVDDVSMTRSGILAGTPQYMSPEQVRGEPIDQRSDLFSLGSAIYAMCTGRPPFRAETSYAVMRSITDGIPAPIRDIEPELPEWLERLVAWLMEKVPDDRPESAEAVEDLLRKCLVHVERPWATPLPPVLIHSPVRFPSQRIRRTAMLGIAIAAIATIAWPDAATTPEKLAIARAETRELKKQEKTVAIARSPEVRVEPFVEPEPVPAFVAVAQAPQVEGLEAVKQAPRRTEMKGETVAGGYRIRLAGTGSVEGMIPATQFRHDLISNGMQFRQFGNAIDQGFSKTGSFRVEGGSFASSGASGQAIAGGGAFGQSGASGASFGQSGDDFNSFEQSSSSDESFGQSSIRGGTFGQSSATSGGFAEGGAGGKVISGSTGMPNFGVALEVTESNAQGRRRKQFVELAPEATIVESNGKSIDTPSAGPISRTFPEFEQRFPGSKAVYIGRDADAGTPFEKLHGKLLVTPGRTLEVHFKGTRAQTRKDDGEAFSLKSVREDGQGYRVVVEYPPTTSMKKARNAFEIMQAMTSMNESYGLTLVDSEGNVHQPVSKSSGSAAGSSFRSVTVNGITRSEASNSPSNSMTTVTYGFPALPENVRVESLVATAIDRQGEPKAVPFTIEIDSE